MDALNLEKRSSGVEPLEETYSRLGFLRKRWAYSLKHERELNAVLIVNKSDLGLNLSEILNSIKVIVTKPENLSWEVLSIAISRLSGIYSMDKVPILFYPLDYVKTKNIPYEKQYKVLIWDARFIGQLIHYIQRQFRKSYWQ